jgi:hypothetical protein
MSLLLGCRGLLGRGSSDVKASRPPGLPAAEAGGLTVKKLLLVVMVALSAFALWRKVQADRAEINLWTEATTADD